MYVQRLSWDNLKDQKGHYKLMIFSTLRTACQAVVLYQNERGNHENTTFLHCVSYYFFFFFSFCGFLFQLRKTAICFMQRRLRALLWKLIPQWWRNNNLLLHSVWSLLYRIWIANRLHCCRNVSRTSFLDIMRTCQDSLPRELFRLFFIIGLYGMRQRLYPLRRPMHWKNSVCRILSPGYETIFRRLLLS